MVLVYERMGDLDAGIEALEKVRRPDLDYFEEKKLGRLIEDCRDFR